MKKIISWNVNGIRAIAGKGFSKWLVDMAPDILCLQETKADPRQLDEQLKNIAGFTSHFASAEKKGYSGVAVYTRDKPEHVRTMGAAEFDREGRTLILEYPDLTVISAYFPNSRDGGARLTYKLEYCAAILEYCTGLAAAKRNFVLCGDFNIAHKPVDLARPRQNESSAGYLPEERAWMDRFVESGFVDTFRLFESEAGNYTWWSYVTKARERNVGWRLDYLCCPDFFKAQVLASSILSDVMGSDHCPVMISLQEET